MSEKTGSLSKIALRLANSSLEYGVSNKGSGLVAAMVVAPKIPLFLPVFHVTLATGAPQKHPFLRS